MSVFLVALATVVLAQAPPASAAPEQRPAAPAPAAQAPAAQDPVAQFPATSPAPAGVLETLQLQVMLDRAGFSPGAIDGEIGANTKKALARYRQQHPDSSPAIEPLTTYAITQDDVAGPFAPAIPVDLPDQASLTALSYTSPLEALAERFHSTPALLKRLNPGAQFAAGEEIQVPNVEPLVAPVARPAMAPTGTSGRNGSASSSANPVNTVLERPDVVVTVSKHDSALTVKDAAGRVIFYAPVTTGSEHDPLPIGEWKVKGVQFNPVFHYNPDLFWDADPSHAKAKIPAGPNNPVGLVWIDLDKDHYGIHGTPEPSAIGRTESHGCVRLTNWDALKLAGMVKPGTAVIFTN